MPLSRPALLAGAGLAFTLVVMAAVAVAAAVGPHDVAYFTREPSVAVAEAGGCSRLGCAAAGAHANLAILVIWTGAVVAAGAAALRRCGPWAPFLLAGSALTALLGLDDAFQLHENVFPEILPGTEREVYALYALVAVAFGWRFRRELAQTTWVVLAVAAACLAGSAGADRILGDLHLVEDGLKLLGFVLWTIYFAGTSATVLGTTTSAAVSGPRPG